MRAPSERRQRGAALMLSLWALFLLSAMVISWALDIDSRLTFSGNASRSLEAVAMACSGAEVALHPQVEAGSSLLRGGLGRGQRFEATITGEGGRLNINWLLAGESPAKLEVLRKYLEVKGVDLNERDQMIDCALDWVDPDNLVRLNGAENDGNYKTGSRLFSRIEDLKGVFGWSEFTSARDWDADFTLNSTGPIDLAWASRDVLLSLPGMTEGLVDQLLALRRGPDGLDSTEDDGEFERLEDYRVALGLTKEQFTQLQGLVGLKDPVLRVVSVGKSGDATRTVRMVIRKNKTGNSVQLLSWKEI